MGRGSERHHRVKEKHLSRIRRETDASHGSSKKRKRDKEERASRVLRGTDPSHRGSKKCKRDKEEGNSSGVDGHIGPGSESTQIKHNRIVKKKHVSRMPRFDDFQRNVKKWPHPLDPEGSRMLAIRTVLGISWSSNRYFAKIALNFYEKTQGAEFEIVEYLYSQCARLAKPEVRGSEIWCHVSFIAKAKNVECSSDISPKHFFAELFQKDGKSAFHAKHCFTFEPSDYPGFNHKCLFCPPVQKFHPADGYHVGCLPWEVVRYDI